MRVGGYIFALLLLGGTARADAGLQDNLECNNFNVYDAGFFAANNLSSGGPTFSVQSTGEIVNGNPFGSVTAWFVDPVAGVDSGACTTSATACHTVTEIARRLWSASLTANVTVTTLGDLAGTDSAAWNFTTAPGVTLTLVGSLGATTGYAGRSVNNTVFSGTVTSTVAMTTAPAAQDTEMTDSSIPTSFTASGMLAPGVILEQTSPSKVEWYVLKDLGSKAARISLSMHNIGTHITAVPVSGNAYVAYQMWKVTSQFWGASSVNVIEDSLYDVGTSNENIAGYGARRRRVWLGGSSRSVVGNDAGPTGPINCVFTAPTGALTMNSPTTGFWQVQGGAFIGTGTEVVTAEGVVVFNGAFVSQGVELLTDLGSAGYEDSFAVFDTSVPCIKVTENSLVSFRSFVSGAGMSGKGNTAALIRVEIGSQANYSNLGALPPFASAATTDATPIEIGSNSYAVAALPPVSDTNLSANTQFPSTVFFKGTPYAQATFDTATANQCLALDATATKIQGVACGGGGAVSSVTGTAQRISATPTTGAVIVDTIGGYYSGAVSGGNEDLGTTLTNGLVCDTTTAGVAVLRTCASGTDYPAVGVATPGSCTNCSATVNANGQVTTYSTGTAPVTSVGVIAPITTTGGTTPSIGISLPSGQNAYGTGTNVTSDSTWSFSTTGGLGSVGSAAKLTASSGAAIPGFYVENTSTNTGAAAISRWSTVAGSGSNYVQMGIFGSNWPAAGVLGPNAAVIELFAGSANFVLGDIGGGDMLFETGLPRTEVLRLVHAGNLQFVNIGAPATPPSGTTAVWTDATSKNWAVKNDAGTVNHGAQTQANSTGVALTALADNGSWTTQTFQAPLTACTSYVSVGCQTGATDIGGSNATTTVIGIEDAATVRGDEVFKRRATPSTPSGTDVTEWNGVNGIESIDGGAVTRFMAKDVTCSGSNVATQIAGGILVCSAPSVACAGLPAFSGPGGGSDLSSAGATCTTQVVAIHDATVTQLVIGTIPDSNPQNTVLIRGSGAASISGVAASVIADTVTKHDYFINFAVNAGLIAGEWASTSNDNFIGTGITIEYPNDFIARHVAGSFDLIASAGIVTGPVTCTITVNGSNISGTGIAFTPGTTANGVYTTGTKATGSTTLTDTYGLFCQATAGLTGATFDFSYQMVLTP